MASAAWATVRDRLHERGLRWTPQRRLLIEVLAASEGHVTGAELLERCRAIDPSTIPSTVYRTLDVLEELGLLSHSHGVAGREEFHVLPEAEHGHLHCRDCGATWEIEPEEAEALIASLLARRRFRLDLSHLTVVGRCGGCLDTASSLDESAGAERPVAAPGAPVPGAASVG